MWDFFNKVVEGRKLPARFDDSSSPHHANKSMVEQYRPLDRHLDVNETLTSKRQLFQRLNKHKTHQLSTISQSIADRADFQRKLNMYLRKRNQSELMPSGKKRRFETPEQRRRMHSLLDDQQLSRKESAPAWMKNPKRVLGLPTIEVKIGSSEQKQRLESFTISIEPLPRDRRRIGKPTKFFKD